jgi:signal transduction histidine kinase
LWAIVLFLIIYFIIRINSRKLEAENLALEKLVVERTLEITEQNKELASAKIEVEQKNSELESLLIELRALNGTKDKMFSIISHDLKNPFTSIIGFASILEDEFETLTEDEKIEFVNKIYNTSTRTYELLENLLNWSRSQSGRIEIQKSNINLSEMIGNNFALLADSAFTKSITLINNVASDCEIYADFDTINTVTRNLITNAIKFSMPGKSVEVKVETLKDIVKISVIDQGVGMSGETLKKLFRTDIFHSTAGTNEEKGTGLGLILCKEFVEKNGGTIEVQSEQGKGSTFAINLPVHSDEMN